MCISGCEYSCSCDRKNIINAIKYEVACELSISYLYLILVIFHRQSQGHLHFNCKYLGNGKVWQPLSMQSNMKSYKSFPLAYLHSTTTNSKSQGQSRTHSTAIILEMVTGRKTSLLPSNKNSCTGFPLATYIRP